MVAQEQTVNNGLFKSPHAQKKDKEEIRNAILSKEAVRPRDLTSPNGGKFNVLHNTQLLLRKYRDLRWAVEQDLLRRVETEDNNIDYIIDKLRDSIEIHEDKVVQNRLKEVIKTQSMLNILENAVESLKTHPSNGMEKYTVIHVTYMSLDPKVMRLKKQGIFDACQMTHGQYYRRMAEAVKNLSSILWQTAGEAYALFMDIYDFLNQVTD